MLRKLALGAALLLGAARTEAGELAWPDTDLRYEVGVVGSALAGAALGAVVAKHTDGELGWAWSKTDTALELAFFGVVTLDAMQTSWFRQRGDLELNPLLGQRPTDRDILLGVGACAFGHALIAGALPKPFRSMWQGGGIGVEVMAVVWNHQLGVGLRVPW